MLSLALGIEGDNTVYKVTLARRMRSDFKKLFLELGCRLLSILPSMGCNSIMAVTHWHDTAKCLAVMDFSPAVCMAPAPNTS